LDTNANAQQILFEIHGLILALHYEARFLKTPGSMERALTGFENILQRYGAVAQLNIASAATKKVAASKA
jgi:hypothetical protein